MLKFQRFQKFKKLQKIQEFQPFQEFQKIQIQIVDFSYLIVQKPLVALWTIAFLPCLVVEHMSSVRFSFLL